MFLYLTYKLHVNSGGRALAGFRDTRNKVHSPNLNIIRNENNSDTLDKVVEEVFGNLGIKELKKLGKLDTFRDVMLASLLEYFEAVAHDCGYECILIKKLTEVFAKYEIYPRQLREWGQALKKDRAAKNAMHSVPEGTVISRIDFLHRQQCQKNEEATAEISKLRSELAEVKEENKEVSSSNF